MSPIDQLEDLYSDRIHGNIDNVYLPTLYETEEDSMTVSHHHYTPQDAARSDAHRHVSSNGNNCGTHVLHRTSTPATSSAYSPHQQLRGVAGYPHGVAGGYVAQPNSHQHRLFDVNVPPLEITIDQAQIDYIYYSPPESSCMQQNIPTVTVEVAPGVNLRLRGAVETLQAIEDDFYVPVYCSCCTTMIFCIEDADFVLCPDCRVVSPVADTASNGSQGVGLGFTMEELVQYQKEVATSRVASLNS
jgi:hypothetical protein